MPAPPRPPGARALGAAETFYTIDLARGDFVAIQAELRAASPTTLVFVEAGEWGTRVTQADADRVLAAFDISTPPGSVDPGQGIARIVESRFGPPTDKDGDGRVHILVLDIRDGYAGGGSYVAGYYTSHDQTDLYGSNRRDLLYIDCDPADPAGTDVLATVAHEHQHLVHYRADRDEAVFVNEGLSEYASYLCGYGLRPFNSYLAATDVPLDAWSNREADYARVSLWTLYLGEQLGPGFIGALFRAPANGLAGIESALAAAGAPRRLPSLLADWFTANAANDRAADPRFGYLATRAAALAGAAHSSYPVSGAASVSQLASDVVSFRNAGRGLRLRLDGTGVSARVVRRGPSAPAVVEDLAPGGTFASPDLGGAYDEVLLLAFSASAFAGSYSYSAAAPPAREREIAYDDGAADELGLLDPAAGRGLAVRFTPEAEVARVLGARVFAGDTTAFELHVWNDRGPGGMPGSDLVSPVRVAPARGLGFATVDLRPLGLEIAGRDFYLGVMGLAGPPLALGLDRTPPVDGRGVLRDQGAWQPFDAIGLGDVDLMVRAEVEYADPTPPALRVGILQHPVFSERADLYVAGDEPLDGASLGGVLRLAGAADTLALAGVGQDERLFVDDRIVFGTDGEGEVVAWGTSRYGSVVATDTLRFVVTAVGAAGGELRLGGAALVLPGGALAASIALTVQAGAAVPGGPPPGAGGWTFGPAGLELARPAELTVPAGGVGGGGLARWDGSGWEPVAARQAAAGFAARVSRLGIYAVLPGAGAPGGLEVVAVSPQPMGDAGVLALELARPGVVKVRLYDVSGRLRAVLFDRGLAAGRQLVPLDLRALPAGQYVVAVDAGSVALNRKILRIR